MPHDETGTREKRLAEIERWWKGSNKGGKDVAWLISELHAVEAALQNAEDRCASLMQSVCDAGGIDKRKAALIAQLTDTLQTERQRVDEAEGKLRQLVKGEISLVLFGGNGCLTDDCSHWDDNSCSMKDPYCRIGRTLPVKKGL